MAIGPVSSAFANCAAVMSSMRLSFPTISEEMLDCGILDAVAGDGVLELAVDVDQHAVAVEVGAVDRADDLAVGGAHDRILGQRGVELGGDVAGGAIGFTGGVAGGIGDALCGIDGLLRCGLTGIDDLFADLCGLAGHAHVVGLVAVLRICGAGDGEGQGGGGRQDALGHVASPCSVVSGPLPGGSIEKCEPPGQMFQTGQGDATVGKRLPEARDRGRRSARLLVTG